MIDFETERADRAPTRAVSGTAWSTWKRRARPAEPAVLRPAPSPAWSTSKRSGAAPAQ